MRGDITIKILETILDGVSNIADVVFAISESGYGAPHSRIERNLQRYRTKRELQKAEMYERQKLYSRIYKLKQEGFISSQKRGFGITRMGKEKLNKLKELPSRGTPSHNYTKEHANETIIFAFDIPEIEKHKREWLRKALLSLDFGLLQKSVWIGKVKLPEEFIEDLKRLKIFQNVQILSISKTGTINPYE